MNFLVNCTLFIYFFQVDLTNILWTQKNIFLLPSTFIWTSSICLCISSWLLLLLAVMIKKFEFFFQISKFLGIFSSRRQNSFWRKKNLKQNWVRNSLVLFVLLYVTYITLSPFFKKFQNLNLQNFFYKKPQNLFLFSIIN